MCEDIPYGPDRKPWKDTVSSLAINGKDLKITPPSQDPLKLYSFPKLEEGITPPRVVLPDTIQRSFKRGIPSSSRRNCTAHDTTNSELSRISGIARRKLWGYSIEISEYKCQQCWGSFCIWYLHTKYKMDGAKCSRSLCFLVER